MRKRNGIIAACWFFNYLASSAQTEYLKGTISHYTGNAGLKAHIALFDGNSFKEDTSAYLSANGVFEIKPAKGLNLSVCLLWFDSGDTISFIAGKDRYLEFTGRWYEGMVVEPRFTNSDENKLFATVKEKLNYFKSAEDSINHAGGNIEEYDPKYMAKSASLKEIFLEKEANYNRQLLQLQSSMPGSYCSRAIIPVLLRNNMADDSIVARKYDNNRSFQHYEYFRLIINDSLMTTNRFLYNKIFDYINTYVNQGDKGLQDGVDEVMKKFPPEDAIGKYALAALVDYFTSHNNYPLVDYLYANYFSTCEMPVLSGKSAQVIEQLNRLSPGNKAPDLAMPDENGNYFWLSQMKKRNYVVLLFWASWCPHCQKAVPEALAYYHEIKSKGIDFVAVSLDDKKQDWLNFIAKNKLDWINISDLRRNESEAINLYALKATPTFYVIDAGMKIIGRSNDLSGLRKLIK